MSKPKYDWWGYIKAVIRRYPALKDIEVSGIALREKEAVEAAIVSTERMPNGRDRLTLVGMVFWEQTHTLEGAALMIPCSERTARRWHTDFIKLVAKKFKCDGLLDESWP